MQAVGWLSLPLCLNSNPAAHSAVPAWLLDQLQCMSALQKDEEDVQAVNSAPHAQYPWQLKCCSQNGETKLYHMPEQDSASLYFAGAAITADPLALVGFITEVKSAGPCRCAGDQKLCYACCPHPAVQHRLLDCLWRRLLSCITGALCCSGVGARERGTVRREQPGAAAAGRERPGRTAARGGAPSVRIQPAAVPGGALPGRPARLLPAIPPACSPALLGNPS